MEKVANYFPEYDENSRLWVFMSERALLDDEISTINELLKVFIPEWKTHGQEMKAGFEVIEKRFIIIGADESVTGASGCSIDSLTRYIKMIEGKIGTVFTNRMLIAWRGDDGVLNTNSLSEFRQKVKSGEIGSETIIYDNSVFTLYSFRNEWKKKLKDSWGRKYLN